MTPTHAYAAQPRQSGSPQSPQSATRKARSNSHIPTLFPRSVPPESHPTGVAGRRRHTDETGSAIRRRPLRMGAESISVIAGPCNHRKDADTRAAGNGGPIPSFPRNYRSGSSLFPNFSTLVSANENPWDSERRGGCKSRAHFSPEGAGVESTAPNFVQPLRKRVADMKHGFESR